MFHFLQRHPFPVVARFRRSLVLTYALPGGLLRPLLPAGLELDEFEGLGFLAVAMVQTQRLRPAGFPAWMGRDFFLSGYRIFVRWRHPDGRRLRGLKILRSDADSGLMVRFGNLLTHYNYHRSSVRLGENAVGFDLQITTPDGLGDVDLTAHTQGDVVCLPEESPFKDFHQARLYAGPMPFTFDYEHQTHSTVVIEGVRTEWHPRPVQVEVRRVGFVEQPLFKATKPVLANSFLVENVDYRWKRGVCFPLSNGPTAEI